MQRKRGQMQISFGFIVGIIVIAATAGVAIFVISHFLNLSDCSSVGLYYQDLEEEVDKAWASGIYQGVYSERVPGGIEEICFGNLTQGAEFRWVEKYNGLRDDTFRDEYDHNVFMLPKHKACDGDLASVKIRHASAESFFCIPVADGEVEVRIDKESSDILAKLSRGS